MVKTIKNIFLWKRKADDLETWYTALSTWVLPSFSNYAPGLTLTYFTARSNLVLYALVWEKVKAMNFSETTYIVVYNIKVGRFSQQNESFMSTKGQGHSLFIILNFFYSVTADFNVSSALMLLMWVIQDQWSSGLKKNGKMPPNFDLPLKIYLLKASWRQFKAYNAIYFYELCVKKDVLLI